MSRRGACQRVWRSGRPPSGVAEFPKGLQVRQAVLDGALRLRQSPLPGTVGAHPWAIEAVALTAAIASGVAAAIHTGTIGPHLEESRLFAAAFAAMAVAQGGWMVLVLVVPSRRGYLAGAGLNGGIILLWLLSRTVGLPVGPHPGVAEPIGAMDATASLAELVAVLGSLVLASRMNPDSSRLSGLALPSALIRVGFGLLVSGFAAGVVADASTGAHDFGSQACCEPGVVGHLIILAGMLAMLAGVLAVAVRGETRPQRRRRTS
jgi:hypothetical protein